MCKSGSISRLASPSKPLGRVDSSNHYANEHCITSKPSTGTDDNLVSLLGSTVKSTVLLKRDGGALSVAPRSQNVCGSPPCRRIPCKARGVSSKHIPENAYFEIPANAPHGLLLSCSSAECARSNRRFRYCRGKLSYHFKMFCCSNSNPAQPM
jgi:hypothetical protein